MPSPLSQTEQQLADALADARFHAVKRETTPEAKNAARHALQVTVEALIDELGLTDPEAFKEACQAPRCYECGSRDVSRYQDGSLASGLCNACERANDL